jgi:hypothetical protein
LRQRRRPAATTVPSTNWSSVPGSWLLIHATVRPAQRIHRDAPADADGHRGQVQACEQAVHARIGHRVARGEAHRDDGQHEVEGELDGKRPVDAVDEARFELRRVLQHEEVLRDVSQPVRHGAMHHERDHEEDGDLRPVGGNDAAHARHEVARQQAPVAAFDRGEKVRREEEAERTKKIVTPSQPIVISGCRWTSWPSTFTESTRGPAKAFTWNSITQHAASARTPVSPSS